MKRFFIRWYDVVVLAIVIGLCVLTTLGYKWASITLSAVVIFFIIVTWIRKFTKIK